MKRRAALLALALLAGGCGGGDDGGGAPPRTDQRAKDAAACAEARRTIAALPKPPDTDAVADYANQAADALEKAGSPAVQALRDTELAAVEIKVRPLNRAARELQRAQGECGEREAAQVLVPAAYSIGFDEALAADRRVKRKAPPVSDLPAALAFDARAQASLARRMAALPVPDGLRTEHERFLTATRRYARELRRVAPDPTDAAVRTLKRIDNRQERALAALDKAARRVL